MNGKEAVDLCQNSSLFHTGTTRPLRGFVLAREFLFANERLASHSFPPCGDGVGDPLIYSRSKKIPGSVTVGLRRWGGGFYALSLTCKKTPWDHEQKITLLLCIVFATEVGFIRHGNLLNDR